MDRDENDPHRIAPATHGPPGDSETHRNWARLERRLAEALDVYDVLDLADGESAANVQRALNEAKKVLRTRYGRRPLEVSRQSAAVILPFPVAARAPRPAERRS